MKTLTRIARRLRIRQALLYVLALIMVYAPLPVSVASTTPAAGTLPDAVDILPGSTIGGGAFDTSVLNQLTITAPDGTILNINTFDIGTGATVNIGQGASDAMLTRVFDGNPTGIMGTLNAPGRFYMVNPAGVIFGQGAVVNVSQLIASSLNISDTDFTNGNLLFQGGISGVTPSSPIGIINNGAITGSEGVALIAEKIQNSGSIVAGSGGVIVLAAGDMVKLGQPGSKIIVEMDSTTSGIAGAGSITNEAVGTISSDSGTIVLASGDIFATAINSRVEGGNGTINQLGSVSANNAGGSVTMTAGNNVVVDGPVTAGGDVYIAGENVSGSGDLTSTGGGVQVRAADNVTVGGEVNADDDIVLAADRDHDGTGDVHADLLVAGKKVRLAASDDTIYLHNDVIAGNDIEIYNNTVADDGVELRAGDDILIGGDDHDDDADFTNYSDTSLTGLGDLTLKASKNGGGGNIKSGGSISADGNLEITAKYGNSGNHNIWVKGGADAGGSLTAMAGGDVEFGGDVVGGSDVAITAHDDVEVAMDIRSQQGSVTVKANADGNDSGHILIGDDVRTQGSTGDVHLEVVENSTFPAGVAEGDVVVGGDITSAGKVTVKSQQGVILLNNKGEVNAKVVAGDDILLQARGDNVNDPTGIYDIRVKGDMTTTNGGDITVEVIDDNVDPYAQYPDRWDDVKFDGKVTSDGKLTVTTGDDIYAKKTLTSRGDMEILAGDDIKLDAPSISAQSLDGNLTIKSNMDNPVPPENDFAEVDIDGDLLAKGDIVIDASENDISSRGSIISSEGDVDIRTGITMDDSVMQVIEATEGTVTADGFINKIYCGELHITGGSEDTAVDLAGFVKAKDNIYIKGNGDVQLSGDVTAGEDCIACEIDGDKYEILEARIVEVPQGDGECCGGVYIISENGMVYTAGADGALSVTVSGYSDDLSGKGVNLSGDPFNDEGLGKAAIVIISKDDLKLDAGATLNAHGFYDMTGAVDDRAGMGLLDVDADIPFVDEHPREKGSPIDVAIFLKSDGDVSVNANVNIQSMGGGYDAPDGEGAMVIDARDTVRFGGNFENSIAAGNVGNWLEVVSRVTEWLGDAYGRLPYADPAEGSGPFPDGYTYVFRGAGAENPDIEDGRAWVLEDLPGGDVPAAPLPKFEEPSEEGCPLLMSAVAGELGVNSGDLQVSIGNALTDTPNIQPCDACEKVVKYAAVLKDTQGQYMASLVQVFNQIAPADAPLTPAMEATLASVFADNATNPDMPQFASAMEYIDAFVQYAAVIDNELGSPVEDSVAFVLGKYGSGLSEVENQNIMTYVQSRLIQAGI